MCIDSLRNGFKRHIDSFYALLVHFGIHTAIFIFFGWQATLFCSVIPHLIAGSLGTYLFYAQHNFPEVHYQVNGNWTYEGAALESSSFLNTNRFMHWATANIGYHHIHHLNARIPFYRLPEIMEKVKGLQSPKSTSLTPSDILKCLRLKIWDEETNRMISA
jgi:omega-6 fatty acid desaturase (delta-12 desaturase)